MFDIVPIIIAGIEKKISPHTLIHTYATQYYKQTKDIETLRRILGHSDISTTTIYITLANIDVENGMKFFKEFYKLLLSVKIFQIG